MQKEKRIEVLWAQLKNFFTEEDKNRTWRIVDRLEGSKKNLASILNEEDNKSLYLI